MRTPPVRNASGADEITKALKLGMSRPIEPPTTPSPEVSVQDAPSKPSDAPRIVPESDGEPSADKPLIPRITGSVSFLKDTKQPLSAYIDEVLFNRIAAYPKGRTQFMEDATKLGLKDVPSVLGCMQLVRQRCQTHGGVSLTVRTNRRVKESTEKKFNELRDSSNYPGITLSLFVAGCAMYHACVCGMISEAELSQD